MGGETLQRTPLYECHIASGARIVPFAGWEMPVQYQGVIEEHMAVRTRAGLFDVSHMGEIEVRGAGALPLLQKVTSNDVARLQDGQAHYSALTTANGCFVDDVLVHRLGADRFFLCVNAANTRKDYAWMLSKADGEVEVVDRSAEFAQIALQGPSSARIMGKLAGEPSGALRRYRFLRGSVEGAEVILARTGYTGEDGFELYLAPEDAPRIWRRLLEVGEPEGLVPAGLAARDTLRLEAKMALYGNDIDETTTVLEADLGWIVSFEKEEFLGREVLARQREEGVSRRLVGFEMLDRGIARQGYPVIVDGREVGIVTSGSFAPFLKKNIGLTYLPTGRDAPGSKLEILIRGKPAAGQVVPTPFYKRVK